MFVSFIVIHIFSSSFVSDFVLNTKRTKRKPNECIWWLRIGWLSFIRHCFVSVKIEIIQMKKQKQIKMLDIFHMRSVCVCVNTIRLNGWLSNTFLSIWNSSQRPPKKDVSIECKLVMLLLRLLLVIPCLRVDNLNWFETAIAQPSATLYLLSAHV